MFDNVLGFEIKERAADAAAVAEDDAAGKDEQQRDVDPLDTLDELQPTVAEKKLTRMPKQTKTAASIGQGNRNAKTSSLLWMCAR